MHPKPEEQLAEEKWLSCTTHLSKLHGLKRGIWGPSRPEPPPGSQKAWRGGLEKFGTEAQPCGAVLTARFHPRYLQPLARRERAEGAMGGWPGQQPPRTGRAGSGPAGSLPAGSFAHRGRGSDAPRGIPGPAVCPDRRREAHQPGCASHEEPLGHSPETPLRCRQSQSPGHRRRHLRT